MKTLGLGLILFVTACGVEESQQLSSSSRAILNASQCNAHNDGAPCGTDCTQKGHCEAGACVDTIPVDDGTPCRSPEFCMADTTCSAGVCGGGTPVKAGTPCQTGNICTLDDHCDGTGACVASEFVNCDDGDSSTSDYCDPKAGCIHSTQAGQTPSHYEGGVGACSAAGTNVTPPSGLMLALAVLALLIRRR